MTPEEERMHDPYAHLPPVPSFTVTSADAADGEPFAIAQMSGVFGAGGQDISPQLSWSGFPPQTQSFAVTMFDPDAPVPSGFWHWAVHDIPADVTSLPTGAGSPDKAGLPPGAIMLPVDGGFIHYVGAAPPIGHGPHRYFIVVHALDVPTLGVEADNTPAVQGFYMFGHTLARAMIVPTARRD
jgi:Raf kinase inhibitor-like YbhB/YbcL family protein